MPARHYTLDYSTNDGGTWTRAVNDEAPGPDKTVAISGLAVGTYAVRLRMTPLSGDTTPIVSNQLILQVGTPGIVEPVQSAAQSVATVADVLTLRDSLLAAIGVQATASDSLTAQEQLQATVTALATNADIRLLYDNLVAAVSTSATSADTLQAAEQLVAAIAAQPTVSDVLHGAIKDNVETDASAADTVLDTQQIAEQLVAYVTPQTTIADGLAFIEQLVATATGQATQSDGMAAVDAVQSAATTTATITDVRTMLETVVAAASAVATQADGVIRHDAVQSAADVIASVSETYTPSIVSTALVPSNATFESGLSPWTDISDNQGGGAAASASVISTAEMTGSKAVQLVAVGGNDNNDSTETGGPTDGVAKIQYVFPVSAIDSAHKIVTFDCRPKDLYAPYGGYGLSVVLVVYSGGTVISIDNDTYNSKSIFNNDNSMQLSVTNGVVAGLPATVPPLVLNAAVNTTYTVSLDILANAQNYILPGHTWAEATEVRMKVYADAGGGLSDGAGGVSQNTRLTVLIDNFR